MKRKAFLYIRPTTAHIRPSFNLNLNRSSSRTSGRQCNNWNKNVSIDWNMFSERFNTPIVLVAILWAHVRSGSVSVLCRELVKTPLWFITGRTSSRFDSSGVTVVEQEVALISSCHVVTVVAYRATLCFADSFALSCPVHTQLPNPLTALNFSAPLRFPNILPLRTNPPLPPLPSTPFTSLHYTPVLLSLDACHFVHGYSHVWLSSVPSSLFSMLSCVFYFSHFLSLSSGSLFASFVSWKWWSGPCTFT